MNKLAPYLVLLAISLGLAYFADQKKEVQSSEKKKWWQAEPQTIEEVLYRMEKKEFKAKRRGERFWVDVREEVEKEAPPSEEGPKEGEQEGKSEEALEAKKAPEKLTEVNETGFIVNEAFFKFLDTFNPLEAVRVIGKIEGDDLSPYGLSSKDQSTLLEITVKGGKKKSFLVGEKSYGSRNIYLYDSEEKTVLLVAGGRLEEFSKADRTMIERKLLKLAKEDITKLQLAIDEKTDTWVQDKKRVHGGESYFWREENATKENTSYSLWVNKIKKIQAIRFADETERSELDQAAELFSVNFIASGNESEKIIFKKIVKDPSDENDRPQYFALSDYLGEYVLVSSNRVEALGKELPGLMQPKKD